MDIFKYTSPTSPTKLEEGEIVNGLTSITWIERYREGGEFKLVANTDSGIRDTLPIGSIISHTETQELMIVENHEVSDDKKKQSQITVSGRGFETILENRIIGSNQNFPVSGPVSDYILAADFTWNQVVALIGNHILAANLINSANAIEYVSVLANVVGTAAVAERSLKRGSLYEGVMALLAIDNLGLKVVRPGPYSPLAPASPNIAIVVHSGNDRSKEVVFSYETGEIESADYLWSNKRLKTSALISGKWIETFVSTADTHYARRMMFIDASDIDGDFQVAPTGSDLVAVLTAMERRGNDAIASQKNIALTKAESNKDNVHFAYSVDFDLGDIVAVLGDYNEVSTLRINEYVEILDETGRNSYPTLTLNE